MSFTIFFMSFSTPTEIFVDKFLKNLKIAKLFLDPTGCHLLISALPVAPVAPNTTQTAELYYLNKNSQKPKQISKFKGVEITAVAFNYENLSEQTTGSILMGSSKGLIFETELSVDGERVSQPNWKQVSHRDAMRLVV
jgi:vacuolar protein sorting-associated protein 18